MKVASQLLVTSLYLLELRIWLSTCNSVYAPSEYIYSKEKKQCYAIVPRAKTTIEILHYWMPLPLAYATGHNSVSLHLY